MPPRGRPFPSLWLRCGAMPTLYTTQAMSTGEGRNGNTALADGSMSLQLAIPKEMGGSGQGANPEQLFALGYSACFHSAVKFVAQKDRLDTTDSAVIGT